MRNKMSNYLSLVKFSHTIFAMPFAFIGFFLGVKTVPTFFNLTQLALLFVLVIACMIFARSAAMAFNRYLDRQFDALNPRTAVREIPVGVIRPGQALIFTVLMSLLFIGSAYLINPLCFALSPVAIAENNG